MNRNIAIDFDGICVSDEYPNVGKNIGAADVLRKIVDSGNNIILLTHRSNTYKINQKGQSVIDKPYLENAVFWFKNRDIPLYGINSNPEQDQEFHPKHNSQKVCAEIIIDYYGMGVPLKYDYKISDKPIADWERIEQWLTNLKIIKPKEKDDKLGGFSFY